MKKTNYVIRVSPDFANRYLAPQSDEDDGPTDALPNTTTDPSMAWRFDHFVEARPVLRKAIKSYPALQFKLDVIPSLRGAAL